MTPPFVLLTPKRSNARSWLYEVRQQDK